MQKTKTERLTQAERRAASEQRLLEAVTEVLIEDGFTKATFDRISERSGYSRGMVRERFGSKDAFVEAAIRATSEELASHFEGLKGQNDTALDMIKAKLGTALWAIKNPNMQAYFVLLCASVANRSTQLDEIRRYHRNETKVYLDLVRAAQAEGLIPETLDARSLAALIGCLAIGIAVQTQIGPDMKLEALQKTIDALFGAVEAGRPHN